MELWGPLGCGRRRAPTSSLRRRPPPLPQGCPSLGEADVDALRPAAIQDDLPQQPGVLLDAHLGHEPVQAIVFGLAPCHGRAVRSLTGRAILVIAVLEDEGCHCVLLLAVPGDLGVDLAQTYADVIRVG